jgi:membrane-bound metal-dependent hydrolase YbcI (DUF457 family)
MPGWKTHVIFALMLAIAWMGALYAMDYPIGPDVIALLLVFAIISSLFPDIDMKKSKMRDMFSIAFASAVTAVYLVFFSESWHYAFAYFVLVYFMAKSIPTKHRGVAHTFRFAALFSLAVASAYLFFNELTQGQFMIWFAVLFSGYTVHIIIDRI